jgi:hypothetical protein
MGLGFVLVLWLVAGAILGAIGAAILGGITSFLTRGLGEPRLPVIRAARFLPFACLIWAGIVFAGKAAVNVGLLHRDIGTGDSWYAPLPNGYQISFVDVTDQGTIEVPGSGSGLNGVRLLQVSGPYLLGALDTHEFEHSSSNTDTVDSYFVIDTHTRKRTAELDFPALKSDALRLGVSLHLEPIYTVYSRYRFTWFDVVADCLLVLPPLAALIALGVWITRLRGNRQIATTT